LLASRRVRTQSGNPIIPNEFLLFFVKDKCAPLLVPAK
jgi:hypothetical protein